MIVERARFESAPSNRSCWLNGSAARLGSVATGNFKRRMACGTCTTRSGLLGAMSGGDDADDDESDSPLAPALVLLLVADASDDLAD